MAKLIVVFVIAFLLAMEITYGLIKTVWYVIKMLSFSAFMKDLGKEDGVSVTRHRNLLQTCFGEKGIADYTITSGKGKYEVSVISFISTRGRWNIEKAENGYYIECRCRHRVFYKVRNHSGVPTHAMDYKGETRFSRKRLYLTEVNGEYEEQILLLYPWPFMATHTDLGYHELTPGVKVNGHTVMDAEALLKTVIDE